MPAIGRSHARGRPRPAALKKISLGTTKITDTGLLKLKALKNLKEVNVPNPPVTLEGARALEREHAGCKVTR